MNFPFWIASDRVDDDQGNLTLCLLFGHFLHDAPHSIYAYLTIPRTRTVSFRILGCFTKKVNYVLVKKFIKQLFLLTYLRNQYKIIHIGKLAGALSDHALVAEALIFQI
jgi:hypothetical protein